MKRTGTLKANCRTRWRGPIARVRMLARRMRGGWRVVKIGGSWRERDMVAVKRGLDQGGLKGRMLDEGFIATDESRMLYE